MLKKCNNGHQSSALISTALPQLVTYFLLSLTLSIDIGKSKKKLEFSRYYSIPSFPLGSHYVLVCGLLEGSYAFDSRPFSLFIFCLFLVVLGSCFASDSSTESIDPYIVSGRG